MIRKKDIILIGVLVLIAGGLLLLLPLLREKPAADADLFLRYTTDDGTVETVPLTEDGEVTVDQGDGMVNVFHVTPQGFSMEASTCHNQLCVYQGEVTAENMVERPLYHLIVCAPHRLVAELLTKDQVEEDVHEK